MTSNIVDYGFIDAETIYEIDLLNKASGATYPRAVVYGANTLGQIIEDYAGSIGVKQGGKIIFENKRTGTSTSDRNETVDGLGLEDGDILALSDDGTVG